MDVVIDFMLRCGIPAIKIFCSSVSGNGVEQRIPDEVKQAINESKVNVVVLSGAYYGSAYCQNEAGIIWYQQQDVPAIVIALPEITHANMQGFLNGDNIVRRLDNRQHIMEIADIVKSQCDDFNCSAAKMSANVDKLIKEYNEILQNRTLPEPEKSAEGAQVNVSDLEQRIMSNDFSDGELVFLKYFYDTGDREVLDDMLRLNQWYFGEDYLVPMGDITLTTLKEDGLLEDIFVEGKAEPIGYRLILSYYRQLRKISQDCYNYICNRLNEYKVAPKGMHADWNALDWCIHAGLSEGENLILFYLRCKRQKTLGAGWKSDEEIKRIKEWEEVYALSPKLSTHYQCVVDTLLDRKWLEVSDTTQYGNPREYSLSETAAEMLFTLHNDTVKILRKTYADNITNPAMAQAVLRTC